MVMGGYPARPRAGLRRLHAMLEAGRERVKLLYAEHLAAGSAHNIFSAPRGPPAACNRSAFPRLPLSLLKSGFRGLLISKCGLGFNKRDVAMDVVIFAQGPDNVQSYVLQSQRTTHECQPHILCFGQPGRHYAEGHSPQHSLRQSSNSPMRLVK